jgi:sugar O-acyltransferase (sialic acid O-acetyltransferase NeuD family)
MAKMQSMVLMGGGGHAAVVAESLRAAGFIMEGFLDDSADADPNSPVVGFKRLGAIADLPAVMRSHRHAYFHAAVGDPALRKKWLELVAPRPTPIVIHPTAIVSPSATLGEAAFIGPRAVINARAVIGRGVIVNSGAIVEHDCVLEEFCHVAPGSVLAGRVRIGALTLVGAGSTAIPGVRIGQGCTIGAGSVVISDIPDGSTAMGVPARVKD